MPVDAGHCAFETMGSCWVHLNRLWHRFRATALQRVEEVGGESRGVFYTSGSATWNGTRTVTGRIFANQPVSLGNGQFDGSIATRGGIDFNG